MTSFVMGERGTPFSQRNFIFFDGKPCAVKVARTVWAGGKSLVDYLSALSRRVIMANSHILLDDSKPDCGTTKYFKLQVDEKIAKIIKDRYMVTSSGSVKLIKDPSLLIGKTINLRSPLYCKCEGGNNQFHI